MHRGEKSSSKICRAREVEKAQELHKKKIDGVKSYLCGMIPKPATSRPSSSFRLRPERSMMASFSSNTCTAGEWPMSTDTLLVNSEGLDEQLIVTENKEILILRGGAAQCNNSTQQNQSIDEFQRSLAKMEEFREVAPVLGLGIIKQPSGIMAPPPGGSRKKSLNGSFRGRRLKEIKSDNAEVLDRIRKSVSHYNNADLRREWHQNVSYLSSICEFPLSMDLFTSPMVRHKHHNTSRSCFGPSPRRPSFLRSSTRTEPLPSIPVVAHPIKSIPTSPKKLQLNMSPAFRSLRKAMPQQPSLPPISSQHSMLNANEGSDFSSNENSKFSSSPRVRSAYLNIPKTENLKEQTTGLGIRHRSSTAIAVTKCMKDFHVKQAANEASGDAKYQLLKTGRFVGGTYLVLTVFCGDGVTNPYGFDVFAYHRELNCEYNLSITKEMTHELLDKSSSSSFAAKTAAAAGTNLSMQEIACKICDHIQFASLGSDEGEMIFLVQSVEHKSDQTLRFDTSSNLVAFCLHQTVELESGEIQDSHGSISQGINKRRYHVFASTSTSASDSNTGILVTTGLRMCFQMMENSQGTSSVLRSPTNSTSTLQVEVSVDELYNILFDSWHDQNRILSLDRLVIAAIRHLHIITVPNDDDVNLRRKELIVRRNVNTMFQPCSSRLTGTNSMQKKRLKEKFPHSTSQIFTQPISSTILVQSGLIWRKAYLLAEVALDTTENTNCPWYQQRAKRQVIQDIDCDLIVSIFNSNSGRCSYRKLSLDNVAVYLRKLEVLLGKTNTSEEGRNKLQTFAKELLTCLQLDVDLFGQEVIVFPALEQACHLNVTDVNDSEQGIKQTVETEAPEDHEQEVLPCWEKGNVSEGDEGADHEEKVDKPTVLGSDTLPFDMDDEEDREEVELCYSSTANQEGGDDSDNMTENLDTAKQQDDQAETPEEDDDMPTLDVPGNEEIGSVSSTHRVWKHGRKIDGQFCLLHLQGSVDDPENVLFAISIAALGHLEKCKVPQTNNNC